MYMCVCARVTDLNYIYLYKNLAFNFYCNYILLLMYQV